MPGKPTYDALRQRVRTLEALEARRTRAERALAHERNLYRDLVSSQPAGVYRVRVRAGKVRAQGNRLWPRLKIEMASPAFCRILGVTLARCRADAGVVAQRVHPDDRPGFTARNVEAANTLRPFQWEGRILVRRRVRWVQIMSVPRRLAHGDVVWTGIVLDATQRRRSEEALQKSETLYRTLFEQAADSVVVFDPDTAAILDFNDAACSRLGYTRDEFARLKVSDLDAMETAADVRRHSRRVIAGREAVFETRHRAKDGGLLDIEVRPKAVSVGGRTIMQCIWRDITDVKRAEERLRHANEALEAKVRERTSRLQALAVELTQIEQKERRRIAHVLHEDLQQRLVAMQYRVLGLHAAGGDPATAASLGRLSRELDEAVQLTRDLTTRVSPPVLNEFGLRAALDWLAGDMQAQYGLAIRIAGSTRIRLPSRDVQAFAFDAVRELLLNVAKHAQVKAARIRVRALRKGRVAIEVIDHGRGCADVRPNATSFGLFSIRERALALGAEFTIASAPGQGTRATLTLNGR